MGCNPLTWIVDSAIWAYRKTTPIEQYKAECKTCGRIRNPETGEYYVTSMGAKDSYRFNSEVREENCPDHPDCLEKRLAGDYDKQESE